MTDTGTAEPQSFARFFAAEVAPCLPALGAARRDRKRNAYIRAVGAAGRLNRSLRHAEDDLRRLAEAFTIPHRLIDNLHGERKPLLPGK